MSVSAHSKKSSRKELGAATLILESGAGRARTYDDRIMSPGL